MYAQRMPGHHFSHFFKKHSGGIQPLAAPLAGVHFCFQIITWHSESKVVSHLFWLKPSQLRIRWTEVCHWCRPSGSHYLEAAAGSPIWDRWIDVPGFKNESLTYIELLDDSNESKRNSNLIHLGVTQLVIFDRSMVKTRVILELYLYLWWCCM